MRVLCITNYSDYPEMETILGLKRRKLDIHVFCPADSSLHIRCKKEGIPVTDMKLKGRFQLSAIRRIRHYLIDMKIDILHLFNSRAISNGILASRKIPVKIIVYRGIVGNVHYLDPGSRMTYLHPRVDHIICVSQAVQHFFRNLKFLWWRFPHSKAVTIYKGHALSWYQKKPVDLRQFEIPESSFVVGCTSRPQPHKGVRVLIDAMEMLPEHLPIHLLLIGNMENSALLKHIGRSPRVQYIHLAGFRPDAPELQASCSAAVLPTRSRGEGLPKVVIEAMAYGIAPIVTDAGGSPELIENGISGIVVPPDNPEEIARAIVHLYRNPEKCKTIGEKARERIHQQFRIETTIEKTFSLYESCLNRHPIQDKNC
jgi:glycosyltransferase involved in cell wall biosynthesis